MNEQFSDELKQAIKLSGDDQDLEAPFQDCPRGGIDRPQSSCRCSAGSHQQCKKGAFSPEQIQRLP